MKTLIVITIALIMYQVNASPVSWWDMTPETVRKCITERVMSIDAATPDVGSVENKKLHFDDRITPIRVYKPLSAEDDLPIYP